MSEPDEWWREWIKGAVMLLVVVAVMAVVWTGVIATVLWLLDRR